MKKLTSILFVLISITVIFFPGISSEAVRESLRFVSGSVIPSLFCFMVISKYAASSGIASKMSLLFRPLSKLIKTDGEETACVVIGNMCGFPTGASLAADIKDKHKGDRKASLSLFVMSNNVSLGFMISYVGAGIFSSVKTGALLYASQLISSLTIGAVMRKNIKTGFDAQSYTGKTSSAELFCTAVKESAICCVEVASFITAFSVVTAYLRLIFSFYGISGGIPAALTSLIELSGGCKQSAALAPEICYAVISFSAAFSGICVIFQSTPYLAKSKVNVGAYTALKLLQGALSLLFAAALRPFCDLGSHKASEAFAGKEVSVILSVLSAMILTLYVFALIKRKIEIKSGT